MPLPSPLPTKGITADDIDNAEEAMQALDDVVNVENSAAVIQKKVIEEGDINGAMLPRLRRTRRAR